MEDFKKLLAEAHKRGIKVILDMVPNHTSDKNPWFINSASSPGAGKRDWYVWRNDDPGYEGPWGEKVWHKKNGSYYYGLFWSGMPDLNYNNNNVTAEIEDITKFWDEDIGIDGFRMDAAMYLIEEGKDQTNTQATRNWWHNYYAFQKNMDSTFMTVGEVWTSTPQVAAYTGRGLDYCFEFDLSFAIINAVKEGDPDTLKHQMKRVINSYPPLQYGTLLTNHDEDRVMNDFNYNVNEARLAAGILLTLPGIPFLYYGEETGMTGTKPDEHIRRPMQWSDTVNAGFTSGIPWEPVDSAYVNYNVKKMMADSSSLWNDYRRLIHLRISNEALRRGGYTEIGTSNNAVMAYLRTSPKESILVIHNFGSIPLSAIQFSAVAGTLPEGSYKAVDLLSGKETSGPKVKENGSFSGYQSIQSLDPLSTYIMKLTRN